MSSDTDIVQDDVKIVVPHSRNHSHYKQNKSKPNFMIDGPKYEEEL